MFTLPPSLYDTLHDASHNGRSYTRQDEDVFTICTSELAGGKRRQLHETFRIPMFRYAATVVLIEMAGHIQVMAVEWKGRRRERQPSLD